MRNNFYDFFFIYLIEVPKQPAETIVPSLLDSMCRIRKFINNKKFHQSKIYKSHSIMNKKN